MRRWTLSSSTRCSSRLKRCRTLAARVSLPWWTAKRRPRRAQRLPASQSLKQASRRSSHDWAHSTPQQRQPRRQPSAPSLLRRSWLRAAGVGARPPPSEEMRRARPPRCARARAPLPRRPGGGGAPAAAAVLPRRLRASSPSAGAPSAGCRRGRRRRRHTARIARLPARQGRLQPPGKVAERPASPWHLRVARSACEGPARVKQPRLPQGHPVLTPPLLRRARFRAPASSELLAGAARHFTSLSVLSERRSSLAMARAELLSRGSIQRVSSRLGGRLTWSGPLGKPQRPLGPPRAVQTLLPLLRLLQRMAAPLSSRPPRLRGPREARLGAGRTVTSQTPCRPPCLRSPRTSALGSRRCALPSYGVRASLWVAEAW